MKLEEKHEQVEQEKNKTYIAHLKVFDTFSNSLCSLSWIASNLFLSRFSSLSFTEYNKGEIHQ